MTLVVTIGLLIIFLFVSNQVSAHSSPAYLKQETSPFDVLKTQEFYENTFDVYFRQLKGDWIHNVTLYTLPEALFVRMYDIGLV